MEYSRDVLFLVAILLVITVQVPSQATSYPEIYDTDITFYEAVFPLRHGDFAGCGYSLPRTLIMKDRIDPGLFVVFEGGKKAGGVFATNQCFGMSGYIARKYLDYPAFPTELSNTITATFSRPLTVQTIRMKTKTPASYRIVINDKFAQNYTVPPRAFWEDRYPYKLILLDSIGFSHAQLQNVTKLVISSTETEDWSFGLDYIRFGEFGPGGGGPPPTETAENPVIFVPGVGGSELMKTGEGIKWLPISITGIGADLDTLADLSPSNQIYASGVFRGIQPQFSGKHNEQSYKRLLQYLGLLVGREYLAPIPSQRTTSGCDMSQDSTDETMKPKLFIFPYDWRQSNVLNAAQLRDYIGCVKRFHPLKKVDIVTHSMGGLLARRYILDNQADGHVDKLVTIAAPWLGAPRAIHSLETGGFIAPAFGSGIVDYSLNRFFASKFRKVIEKSPGPLQLLPSRYYYGLYYPKSPFNSRRLGRFEVTKYNYSETMDFLNSRHSIKPGDVSSAFHDGYDGLQDSWRTDVTNVRYYHIYAQQDGNKTVGRVNFFANTLCTTLGSPTINCVNNQLFIPHPTNGDGTVPLISSRRISPSGNNLNLNHAKRYFENAKVLNGISEDDSEHTKITENIRVYERIRRILTNQPTTEADCNDPLAVRCDNDASTEQYLIDGKVAPLVESASFYVSLENVEGFRASNFAQPTLWGSAGHNGMQAVPMNDKSAWIAVSADDTYQISFFGDGTPIRVGIIKGLDYDRIEQLINYIDLEIPANAMAELTVSPTNNPILFYDSNNDGFPDTFISPTISVTGPNAMDIEPPVISFDYQPNGAGRIVTLSATDDLSGVRKIYYSLDGVQFTEYTTPVTVGGGQNVIYVFAEDNNFNRTGIAPIDILGSSYSIGNRVWFDSNNDGKINNDPFLNERGVDGAAVSLFADSNGDGQPDDINLALQTTATDSDGYYRFDELIAGNYVVRVDPANFTDTAALAGFSNTSLQSSDDTDSDAGLAGENGILPGGPANNVQTTGILSGTIALGPLISEPLNETDASADDKGQIDGYANLTVDFGFYKLAVSGTLWSDNGAGASSDNGILDTGEAGLPNFQIRAFENGGGEVQVGPDGTLGTTDDAAGGVLTDSSGNYSFKGLAEGDYVVKINRQSVNSSSIASNTPNDNADFDNNGTVGTGPDSSFVVSAPITLTAANRGLLENTGVDEFTGITDDSTLDFGMLMTPTAAGVSMQGSVVSSTGLFISRAQVVLTNTSTNEVRNVQTNHFGYFSFADLPAGNLYVISVNHKEYNFTARTIQLVEDVSGFQITADAQRMR